MQPTYIIFFTAVITALAGTITIGIINMIVKPVKKAIERIETVAVLSDQMKEVVRVTNITAHNSTSTRAAVRTMIRAFRSICFSMEEAGFNGSIKNAKALINQSEDDINEQSDRESEEALTIRGEA